MQRNFLLNFLSFDVTLITKLGPVFSNFCHFSVFAIAKAAKTSELCLMVNFCAMLKCIFSLR